MRIAGSNLHNSWVIRSYYTLLYAFIIYEYQDTISILGKKSFDDAHIFFSDQWHLTLDISDINFFEEEIKSVETEGQLFRGR